MWASSQIFIYSEWDKTEALLPVISQKQSLSAATRASSIRHRALEQSLSHNPVVDHLSSKDSEISHNRVFRHDRALLISDCFFVKSSDLSRSPLTPIWCSEQAVAINQLKLRSMTKLPQYIESIVRNMSLGLVQAFRQPRSWWMILLRCQSRCWFLILCSYRSGYQPIHMHLCQFESVCS